MHQITKIVNYNNEIRVHHSNEVLDKRTHYEISFDSVYKGHKDYYIKKEVVQTKQPQYGQLDCKLYMSTETFNKDPQKWIELFKQYHESRYGKYKWYKDLVYCEK